MNTVNYWLILYIFLMLYRSFELKDSTKKVLRVGMREIRPFNYVSKRFDNTTVRFGGLIGNLFNLIADILQFRLEHFNRSDLSKLLPNGTWTGKIGDLLRNHSDIAIGIIDPEEMKVIGYTNPFVFDEVKFIVKKPAELSKVFIITRPFGKQLWIATFTSLFLGLFALYFLIRAEWNRKPNRIQYGLKRIAWMLFSEMINQGDDLVNKINIRWMLSGWLLAMAVVIACYEGNLSSFMINPGFQVIPRTFSSLREAVISGEYCIVGSERSSVTKYIQKSNSTLMKIFAKSMVPDGIFASIPECFNRAIIRQCAFINYEIIFELMGSKYAGQYVVSNDQLFTTSFGFLVRKNYPFRKKISKIATSAFEAGLIMKWKRNIISHLPKKKKSMDSLRPLNMLDLQGAFYLLILGYIAGICSLLIELMINRCKKCRKSRKTKVFR